MSHPIFGVDELLRLVIEELAGIGQRSTVSFALTCRAFEEPTLSSLWKEQPSLFYLLKVLPNYTLAENEYNYATMVSGCNFPAYGIPRQPQNIKYDASAEDWARLRRCASWMRGLRDFLYGAPTTDVLLRLSRDSSGRPLFPKLEWLHWDIYEAHVAFPFLHLLLPSPHLRRITLYIHLQSPNISQEYLGQLVQVISLLPTPLEYLFVRRNRYLMAEKPLKDTISSLVCRCGPSLRTFSTCIPLSEAAIHHLVQLPNLSYWRTTQGPPRIVPTSIFPSLEKLDIDKEEALPWLHLFASAASHTNVRQTLKYLNYLEDIIIDSTFLSSIAKFRNLVTLQVSTYYCGITGGCFFHITDNDVKDLAVALPRLEILRLGEPCRWNTCGTTVASLVLISVHCLDLTHLETHFNTQTIVGDMQGLLDGGAERDRAKCKLRRLLVGCMPLDVYGKDIRIVALGFKVVFPHLTGFEGCSYGWQELMRGLTEIDRGKADTGTSLL